MLQIVHIGYKNVISIICALRNKPKYIFHYLERFLL